MSNNKENVILYIRFKIKSEKKGRIQRTIIC